MYVIGTAGHIDHGKTSLIQALTGIDCDRLPEEKARAMTIDIGFASFDIPKFGAVSVIDVPGHERFIRNMVAGAWGMDMALLVVAADDGWMPQTDDHFRVLRLLGIERMIVCINKADLVDEEMLSLVEDEIRDHLAGSPHEGSDIIPVSAKTGAGIKELRDMIALNLKKLSAVGDMGRPYLFVDRVFIAHGHGTVVTGTLKNGHFRENDTVTLLPGEKSGRIKRIESHKKGQSTGGPSQRTALNIAGIAVEDVSRGHVVVRDNFFTPSTDVIVRVTVLDREVRNNRSIELLAGTMTIKGKLIVSGEGFGREGVCRVRLEETWHSFPGQKFVMTAPGGFRIIGGGVVLYPGYNQKRHRKRLGSVPLEDRITPANMMDYHLALDRCVEKDILYSRFTLSPDLMEKTLAELVKSSRAVQAGRFVYSKGDFSSIRDIFIRSMEKDVGLNLAELAFRAGIDVLQARPVMDSILADSMVVERDGRFFYGQAVTEENLPEEKRVVLLEIGKRGYEGIELDRVTDDKTRKELGELIRLGFVISLDGVILYHRDVYNKAREQVLTIFDTRERFTVTEAKDVLPLSRKYMIPLLNRLERDGVIRRLGDYRIRA